MIKQYFITVEVDMASISKKLRKQAEIFGKFGTAFEGRAAEAKQKDEIIAEVCQGLQNICLLLAQDAEEREKAQNKQ
jgi:hypothetical protein